MTAPAIDQKTPRAKRSATGEFSILLNNGFMNPGHQSKAIVLAFTGIPF